MTSRTTAQGNCDPSSTRFSRSHVQPIGCSRRFIVRLLLELCDSPCFGGSSGAANLSGVRRANQRRAASSYTSSRLMAPNGSNDSPVLRISPDARPSSSVRSPQRAGLGLTAGTSRFSQPPSVSWSSRARVGVIEVLLNANALCREEGVQRDAPVLIIALNVEPLRRMPWWPRADASPGH